MAFTLKRSYFIGILIIFFLSCSKNSTTTPNTGPVPPIPPSPPVIVTNGCAIVAATEFGPNNDTLAKSTYDYYSDGRLKSSKYVGAYTSTVNYLYDRQIIYRLYTSDIVSSIDTMIINDAGFLVHDRLVFSSNTSSSPGSDNFTYDCIYDSLMQIKIFLSQMDVNPPDAVTYKYSNGDNIQIKARSAADTLIYDTSTLAVKGNLDHYYQLSTGAMILKNKHLVSSRIAQNRNDHRDYSYTFNSDGNISSVSTTVNGAYNGKIVYTYYGCN